MIRLLGTTAASLSLLLFHSTTTTALISLADFVPAIPNLPTNCNTVYRFPIAECQPREFEDNNACSDLCIGALTKLVPYVERTCAGVDVGPDTIIGIFLAGNGVTRLCPGAASAGGGGAGAVPVPAPSEQEQQQQQQQQQGQPSRVPESSSGNDGDANSYGDGERGSEGMSEFEQDVRAQPSPTGRSSSSSDRFEEDAVGGAGASGSSPTRSASADGAEGTGAGEDGDEEGDESGEDGEDDEGSGDEENGGGGSPFDEGEDGQSGSASLYRPTLSCAASLLLAVVAINML